MIVEGKNSRFEKPTVKIMVTKIWCDRHLSPKAWTRLILRNLIKFSEYEYTFDEVMSPALNTRINKKSYMSLLSSLVELYGESNLEEYKLFINDLILKHNRSKK